MIRRLILLACPLALFAQNAPAPAPANPSAAAEPATTPTEEIISVPEPGRFKRLFQPFRTETAALSPDGKYVAYSVREGESLSVAIVDLEHPDKIKTAVEVIKDDDATPMLELNQREKNPGRINWMRWVTPTRLVVETNALFTRTANADAAWQGWRGAILGFDADGTNAKLIARPNDLMEFAEDKSSANSFSTARGASAGFNARVALPSEPAPAAGAGETGAYSAPTLLPEDGPPAIFTPPAAVGATSPRTLRVFDVDPLRAGAVTVIATGSPRAAGSRSIGFYSLNGQTGKLTDLSDELILNTDTALLDRQGRPRLTLPNTLLTPFPFRYEYRGAKGRDRGKPLDELAGLRGFTVSPDNYFGERALPLGFGEDPNLLYFAANTGRDTYGLYSLDLTTRKRGTLSIEHPSYDLIPAPTAGFPDQNGLVFDRFKKNELIGVRYTGALRTTVWLRPEWQGVQTQLEKSLPGRNVQIVDWDEAGRRFIVATDGPADAGAFHLYDREKNRLVEFVRRAPWIDATHNYQTLPFGYTLADGSRISGLITVPQQPRLKPIPMVVLCPDLPWQRLNPDYHTEVQALAEMGFVVVQFNGRGVWGLGLKQRQALTAGYDLVQVEDIATTVAVLEKMFNVNPRRVALLGSGHGGFIALRALQAYPDRFRCAIALDAPINLADWLSEQKWSDDTAVQPQLTRAWFGDAARLKDAPLDRQPEAITKPVLLFSYPGIPGEQQRPVYLADRSFTSRVARNGGIAEFEELTVDYMSGLPAARAAVFDRIEEFLNLNVYDYKVKVPETKMLKPTTPQSSPDTPAPGAPLSKSGALDPSRNEPISPAPLREPLDLDKLHIR